MPREISLNARTSFNAGETSEVPIVLIKIDHDDLDAPIYLSSDPTVRLSDDPLRYGTISNDISYEFVLMAAVLPGDEDRAPPAAKLVFANVKTDMVAIARSVSSPPSVDMTVVLASSPDLVEVQYLDLKAVRRSYDAERLTLNVSREPITSEPWPFARMTKERFPGLFR